MAIAITLIICATVFGCVAVCCIFSAGDDWLEVTKRTHRIEKSVEELVETNKNLVNKSTECEVVIKENFPKMSYTIDVSFYDIHYRSDDEIIKVMAKEITKVYRERQH